MLKRIMFLFGLGLLISPCLLHADTITTFALDGFTFQSPATLTGTITIDVTTGITTGINATYSAGSLTDHFTTVQSSSPPGQTGYASMQAVAIASNDGLELSFPTPSLVGYTGGVVCTYPTGQNCPFGFFRFHDAHGICSQRVLNTYVRSQLDPVRHTRSCLNNHSRTVYLCTLRKRPNRSTGSQRSAPSQVVLAGYFLRRGRTRGRMLLATTLFPAAVA